MKRIMNFCWELIKITSNFLPSRGLLSVLDKHAPKKRYILANRAHYNRQKEICKSLKEIEKSLFFQAQ